MFVTNGVDMRIHPLIPISVFLIVNVPPWFGFSYLYVVFQWATLQGSLSLGGNLEFPITYASAVMTFVLAAYFFRSRTELSVIRAAILAVGLSFAATALFEVIYQILGYLYYPSIVRGALSPANYVLNASWIFLAFTSTEYWKFTKRFTITAVAFVLSWLAWLGIGFPQLFQSNAMVALVANSITKVLSFALFLSIIDFHGGRHQISRLHPSSQPAAKPPNDNLQL